MTHVQDILGFIWEKLNSEHKTNPLRKKTILYILTSVILSHCPNLDLKFTLFINVSVHCWNPVALLI